MLRSVFTKTLWDRRASMVWWVLGTMVMTAFLVAFFPTIRDSPEMQDFIADFPPELLTLFGIDPVLYQTGFGYLQAQLYSLVAPIIVVALAMGIGGAATAKEEEDGTADLVLSVPVRRERIVVDNAVALAVLVGIVVLAIAVVLVVSDPIVDLRLETAGIVGISLGLWLLGLFFGGLTMLVAAWLGKRATAVGLAGAIAAAAFFWNGFAPLIEGFAGTEVLSPFHWYLRDDPLLNGPTVWHLLLIAVALMLIAGAAVAFRGRQIGTERRLVPRRRRPSSANKVAGARSARLLRNAFTKTLWDRRVTIWWWAFGVGALSVVTIAFYPTIRAGQGQGLDQLIEAVPREMLAIFGITDPSALFTGAGFVSSRVYSSIGMVIVLALAIGLGSGATAKEEDSGTADLVLAAPLRRMTFVAHKYWAMVVLVTVVAVVLFVIVVVGDAAVDLDLTWEGAVAGNIGLALLAILFGSLAMAVGAWTGRAGAATGAAAGVAIAAFFINGLGAAVDWLEPLRPFSPFYWYQGDLTPLTIGFTVGMAALAGVGIVLAVAAGALFGRRDIGT